MDSITKEQIQLLVQIQKIGVERNIALAKLSDAPSKKAALEKELENSRAALVEAENRLSELRKKYRDIEGEVQREQSREKKNQEKLMSIKTNKEYHSMLKEIADLKERISKMEDEMLAVLDEQEILESDIIEKKKENEIVRKKVEREVDLVNEEIDACQKKASALEKQMAEMGGQITPDLFKKYKWVEGRVGQNPIVSVVRCVCQGCHLNIPPQMYNELQRFNRLEFCPHCQRIIYWSDGSEWSGRSPD